MSEVLLGGQAVMEGVMMRGPAVMAVAVRQPNGNVVVEQMPLPQLAARYFFMRWPVFRGMRALWQALVLGLKAISRSAELAEPEQPGESALGKGAIAGAMVVAMALAVGLFFMLPLALTQALARIASPVQQSAVAFNLIEGVIRLAVFLGYLAAIRLMPDVKRFFQYHGAEHKAIYTFEAGEPLDVDHARAKSPLHPRCGTNFLMTVMVVAILVISLTPHDVSLWVKAGWRLSVVPFIAGLSFELIRWSTKNASPTLKRLVTGPGMCLQRLTTIEPDDEQLDVALQALRAVDLTVPVQSEDDVKLIEAAAS